MIKTVDDCELRQILFILCELDCNFQLIRAQRLQQVEKKRRANARTNARKKRGDLTRT